MGNNSVPKFIFRLSRFPVYRGSVLGRFYLSNFMKIRPVGAELFHADGRTDRHDDANRRFSQFCEKRLKAATETSSLLLEI